jgi:hypothetical protein
MVALQAILDLRGVTNLAQLGLSKQRLDGYVAVARVAFCKNAIKLKFIV